MVAGTATVYGFTMAGGASSGYVLTSNGSGQGTWQPLPAMAPPGLVSGSDFVERFSMSPSDAVPGDVMVIDTGSKRSAVRSSEARSTLVAGVFGAPTVDGEIGAGEVPLAVIGVVRCNVSTENGPISAGDLLVTSSTPGHAMRGDSPRPGTVLGKALEDLASGAGTIEILVTLH